ncbi:metallophosphoesterase [Polaribacter litorisediminis]|uniref:metallophosphoesterase n=1 Tax=Polaribacter litorisediminis TaxID=1908341 RepID=UPI001CBEFB1C|nr:metallophosphoesterase [Polaribacter litorisediminis]UAM99283.1 metallophosphoesterase [Polaribacter litorisediminis]
MQRRKFIKKALIATFGLGFIGGTYSWQIEPFWLEFVHKKMPIKNLPENLIGKTLLQISDIHIGNRFNYQYIIDSFVKAKAYNPDFVVYTGDFVDHGDKAQAAKLAEVFKHAVKGKLGTAGVLGNHDYGHNWSEQNVANTITAILENAGIKILGNEQYNFNGLHIIGLDDFWGLNFNPKKIMNKHNAKNANVVLCHNPDVCDLDVWNNYEGWILAGHTHGGQVKPPFLNPPILPVKNKEYIAGEITLKEGRTLYINRALGNLHQIRFNVRPEITVFKLEKIT